MEEREKAKNQEEKLVTNEGEEEPLLKGSQICPLWAFATPGRKFRWEAGSSGGTQPTVENYGARNWKNESWPELPPVHRNFRWEQNFR